MEHDNQIFIQLDPDKGPVEFLLLTQPMRMIRGGIVTKETIREAIETGFSVDRDHYIKSYLIEEYELLEVIEIRLNDVVQVIEEIEKRIS